MILNCLKLSHLKNEPALLHQQQVPSNDQTCSYTGPDVSQPNNSLDGLFSVDDDDCSFTDTDLDF